MRVVGGSARGRTLVAPKGDDTRPTSDLVRESVFNILAREIPDARVLDLFAGSGALSMEALSRGAQSAVLVDASRLAANAIARNIAALRVESQATLWVCDWKSAVRRLAGQSFDLLFLDPPYRMVEVYAEALSALRENLPVGALAVLEHARETELTLPEGYARLDERRYGAARVTIAQRIKIGGILS